MVAGGPALLLSREDELLLLAVHLVRRSLDRVIQIADLAHLIAIHGESIRWEAVRERAIASRVSRLLELALESAAWLGVAPRHGAGEMTAARGLPRFVMRRALALRPVAHGGTVLLALAAPRPIDRIRFLCRALLGPRDTTPPKVEKMPLAPPDAEIAPASPRARSGGAARREIA
jgi:hypothetical protein